METKLLEDDFDKYLNCYYGEVVVAGEVYTTSEIFKKIDILKYRVEFAKWILSVENVVIVR